MRYNKVRGILRAKQGSQVPKFKVPSGPIEYNSNITGTITPTPKPDATLIGAYKLHQADIKAGLDYAQELRDRGVSDSAAARMVYRDAQNGWGASSSGKWVYKGLSNPGKLIGSLQKGVDIMKDKAELFLLNNPELANSAFNAGLDFLSNKFDDTEDSKVVDGIFQAGDAIGLDVPQVKIINTALKGVNSLLGSNTRLFSINQSVANLIGGSYGGSMTDITNAANKAGKKYGLFSGGSRRKANNLINEAEWQQNIMMNIANDARDMQAMSGNDLNYLNYNFNLSGGYDQRYMRAARSGMKLLDRINFIKLKRILNSFINLDTKLVEEFKEGGKIQAEWEPIIEDLWEPVIDIFQKGGKTRTLEELIEYAKKENPRFIQRLSEDPRGIKFIDNEGNEAEGSHYLMSAGDLVVPLIQEVDGELKFFDEENAINRAIEKGNYLKMSPEEAIIFAEGYKQGWPKFFFKEVYDYYKDYDLSNAVLIRDNLARTEGNKIYVNTDEDAVHELWHFLSQNKPNEKYKEFYDNLNDDRITELGGNLNFVKRHEGDPGHFYHPSELEARIMAAKFKSLGLTYTKDFFKNLRSDENKYGYNMRDLLYMFNDENLEKIFNLKKGGTLGEGLETPEIEETNQKNLIPEGALHKNKHHMEHTEGLTLKGIPVIDNEGEQLAEIELDEIIFTLEVTKKLEELYKEGTDEAAIEAGKLLVKEILFNTDDRTGLISKCEKGGKL